MRWSQVICLFTVLLGITVDQVLARPAVDPRSDVKLVRRGKAKLSVGGIANMKVQASNLAKTAHLKSSTYRNAALKEGKEYDPTTQQIGHNPAMTSQNSGHLHADHVYEVQTALKTIKGQKIDPKHHDAIKAVLNHPDNLVMAPADINKNKGQTTGAALRGGAFKNQQAATTDYMRSTSHQALSVANQLDKITGGTHFTDAQNEIHKQAGI